MKKTCVILQTSFYVMLIEILLSSVQISLIRGSPVALANENNLIFGTVADIDGNVYNTIKIGNQVWTVENLRTTKYRDGTPIPFDTSTTTWENATKPKYCYYQNMTNTDSIKKFGALYNWYVVDTSNTKKIAPPGWHVSTDAEWMALEKYLVINGYNWDGSRDTTTGAKIAKSLAAKTDWVKHSYNGVIGNDLTLNNRSGFSALPGGDRNFGGIFGSMGVYGGWWSVTECGASIVYGNNLNYCGASLFISNTHKSTGLSVRLLKN